MCFSATASFTLSGVMTAVGATSISRNSTSQYRLFAATPLLFAAQQALEGLVWLTIDDPGRTALNHLAVDGFLGVALVVWPIWLPYAMRHGERNPARRRIFTFMVALGVMVAVGAIYLMTRLQPVAVVAGHSIRYDRAGTSTLLVDMLVLLAYFATTVGPLFVSTLNLTSVIGVALAVSLAVAATIQVDTLTSVWCFFAAAISGLVLVAVARDQRSEAPARVPVHAG